MNPKCDRRDIAGLLAEHFPSMPADATSDDWHGFLDAQTGLQTPIDEENATAFDRWRQALAGQGTPVWGIDDKRKAEVATKGVDMKKRADAYFAGLPKLLEALAKEALGTPLVNP